MSDCPSISFERLPPESYLVRIHEPGGQLGDPYERAFVVCRDPDVPSLLIGKGISKPADDCRPILSCSQARAVIDALRRNFSGVFRWDRRDAGEHRRSGRIFLD